MKFMAVFLLSIVSLTSNAQIKKNFKSSRKTPAELVRQSMSDSPQVADLAIRLLRAKGPKAIDYFLREFGSSVGSRRYERVNTVFDMICQQHNCYSSRLFWFRNFDEARAYAERMKRPVLSLQMIGSLTDELACFDARIFRAVFYADNAIGKYLKENFVLHWQSDRPVPKIVIDYGDGRKITQTAAGHGTHYTTNYRGEVIGSLPGVYTSQYFLSYLKRMKKLFNSTHKLKRLERFRDVKLFHEKRLEQTNQYWQRLNGKIKNQPMVDLPGYLSPNANEKPVDGRVAVDQSSSRSAAEAAVIESIVPEMGAHHRRFRLTRELDQRFDLISSKIEKNVKISQSTLSYISSKYIAGTPLDKKVGRLRISLAKDTLRNQYIYERNIHNWLRSGGWAFQIEGLSRVVRNTLFLIPNEDQWQGLWDGDVYNGLTNDGLNVISRVETPAKKN